jgi:hypothetical protein
MVMGKVMVDYKSSTKRWMVTAKGLLRVVPGLKFGGPKFRHNAKIPSALP